MRYEDRQLCYQLLQSVLFILQERDFAVNQVTLNSAEPVQIFQDEASFMQQFGRKCLALRTKMSFKVYHRSIPNKSALVLFMEIKNPCIQTIRRCLLLGEEQQVTDLIIVVHRNVTFAGAELVKMQRINVQVFTEEDILLAPKVLNHISVPQHTLLTTEKVNELTRHYRSPTSTFPKISFKDIICRYLGFGRGDVLRIQRRSDYIGSISDYRVVI